MKEGGVEGHDGKRDNSFPRKDSEGEERVGRRKDKAGGLSQLLGKD